MEIFAVLNKPAPPVRQEAFATIGPIQEHVFLISQGEPSFSERKAASAAALNQTILFNLRQMRTVRVNLVCSNQGNRLPWSVLRPPIER
jgi:hypothetical protein